MPNDREKLLNIMNNLESDYRQGRISAEKYSYFRSKYEDKLNSIDAEAATRNIRSMQGKPASNTKKKSYKKGPKPTKNSKKEEQDLVQKYIINPKKGDTSYKNKKEPMDKGTFKLLLILVIVIGFTVGIAYGIFSFDFESVSETEAVAIVEDTAFPEIKEIPKQNTTNITIEYNSSDVDDTIDEYSEPSNYDDGQSNNDYNDQPDSGGSSSEGQQSGSGSSTGDE